MLDEYRVMMSAKKGGYHLLRLTSDPVEAGAAFERAVRNYPGRLMYLFRTVKHNEQERQEAARNA